METKLKDELAGVLLKCASSNETSILKHNIQLSLTYAVYGLNGRKQNHSHYRGFSEEKEI